MDDPIKRNYFIQMFFPNGSASQPFVVCEQILLEESDVVLNMAAQKLGGNSKGILVLFGLGKTLAFKYENKKLKELQG